MKSFNRAIACRSDFVDAYFGLADLFRMLGREPEAILIYGRLVAAKPDSFEAWLKQQSTLEE